MQFWLWHNEAFDLKDSLLHIVFLKIPLVLWTCIYWCREEFVRFLERQVRRFWVYRKCLKKNHWWLLNISTFNYQIRILIISTNFVSNLLSSAPRFIVFKVHLHCSNKLSWALNFQKKSKIVTIFFRALKFKSPKWCHGKFVQFVLSH